jgi:glycosyltransferase involved in cell wall biosynthesis
MRELGYESTTLVHSVYSINSRDDFDLLRPEFGPRTIAFEPFRDYLVFAWVLRHADIVSTFFDGGFLSGTAVRSWEGRLLHLAGKRLIVSPFGSDIAVPGFLGPYEEAMGVDYPDVIARGQQTRARVDWFCRHADVIVRNVQPGYQPRWDVVWPSQLAIDTEAFAPGPADRGGDGHDGAVVVVHAPNHRTLKGTDVVIAAVDDLRRQGLEVVFELLERRPNTEVRAALASADILAEQFLAGFGMLAVEGMASGTTVVSNIGWIPDELRAHPAIAECPIVDANARNLDGVLADLAADPARRTELGRLGREHVLRWHSYASVGRTWASIIDAAWADRAPAPEAAPLERGEHPGY